MFPIFLPFSILFFISHAALHVGSQFPNQGSSIFFAVYLLKKL